MSDAQSLLVILALIYVSDCLIWLRRDGVAVVITFRGRAIVRRPSSWAANDRGGLAFTTLLPARAVFVCDAPDGSFAWREIDARAKEVQAKTGVLRLLAWILFGQLFIVAPALAWRFGFAQIGLLLIAAFAIANAVIAFTFFRTHRRIDRGDRWHRWTHAIVMLIATPSAVRAVDQATRHAMRGFDPLAVASRLAGNDDPLVRTMLRELAHPLPGANTGARHDAAHRAGLAHREEPPQRSGEAALYCPRCLSQYVQGTASCTDCGIALSTTSRK
jgi:hypothetical protein